MQKELSETGDLVIQEMRLFNPPTSDYRSSGQQDTISFILQSHSDGVIVLPPGNEKSLIYTVASRLNSNKMIILVIPFRKILL